MRLITWNVNGLRAHLNKGAWDWTSSQNADIVCYQEIKARPEQLTKKQMESFEDFTVHWNPAKKLGYSGVATFSRNEIPESKMVSIPSFLACAFISWSEAPSEINFFRGLWGLVLVAMVVAVEVVAITTEAMATSIMDIHTMCTGLIIMVTGMLTT